MYTLLLFSFQAGGMKDGDYIVGINDHDVKWSPHDEVVSLIKAAGHSLKLRVVTPMSAASTQQQQSKDKKEKVRGTQIIYFFIEFLQGGFVGSLSGLIERII